MSTDSDKTDWVQEIEVNHELRGVTPDMIDWWWVNMEKAYPLWHPVEHKSFVWEVAPPEGGYLGAIQRVEESIGGGDVRTIRIRWDAPETSEVPIIYEHVLIACSIDAQGERLGAITHQYQATDYGTVMRSTMHYGKPRPPQAGAAWARHDREEVATFPGFLPQLYSMWQVVNDPTINRQACMKYRK